MLNAQPSRVFWMALLGVCCQVLGCTTAPQGAARQTTFDDEGRAKCSSDDDCPDDLMCSAQSALASLGAANKRLAVPAPPPPCAFTACGDSSTCGEGLVCVPSQQALHGGFNPTCGATVCASPCVLESDCLSGEVCRESGLCEILLCDEDGGPTCGAESVCEPSHAEAQADGCRRLYCDEPGSAVCAQGYACDPEGAPAGSFGCRLLRCDEPEAVACSAPSANRGDGLWECEPSAATDATGCVPVPCTESGLCYSEDFICTPTSSATRALGSDTYGCVRRNCEEGLSCFSPLYLPDEDGMLSEEPIDIGYCDYAGPNATLDGCAQRHCSELERGCGNNEVCDRDSDAANARGCRPLRCDEAGSAGCGAAVCEPSHRYAGRDGCRPPSCEELESNLCPATTECNPRGANANALGCAPLGDPDVEVVTPTATIPLDEPPPADSSSTPPAGSDLPVTTDPSSDEPSSDDPSSDEPSTDDADAPAEATASVANAPGGDPVRTFSGVCTPRSALSTSAANNPAP